MKTLPATIVPYRIDTSTAKGTAAYKELQDRLLARGFRPMNVNLDGNYSQTTADSHKFVETIDAITKAGGRVEIETKHLFADQWNTAPQPEYGSDKGLRIHQWCRFEYRNRHMQHGYYVELSPELSELVSKTLVCGYCGTQYAPGTPRSASHPVQFCESCIGSPYLKQSDLYLTRLRPVSAERIRNDRPPLSTEESAVLVPAFAQRLAKANVILVAKKKAQIERNFELASEERTAAHWILDHFGPALLDNYIFYSHKEPPKARHCFGWRIPLSNDEVSFVLDKISEFPYAYQLKTESRGVLESYSEA